MNKKIMFFLTASIIIIFIFFITGCQNPQGGELEIHNATGEGDNFYAVVFIGAFSRMETIKKIRDFSDEDKLKNIVKFSNDEKKKYSVHDNSVVTYYWWKEKETEDSNYENPESYDFGAKFIENGNMVTITAK